MVGCPLGTQSSPMVIALRVACFENYRARYEDAKPTSKAFIRLGKLGIRSGILLQNRLEPHVPSSSSRRTRSMRERYLRCGQLQQSTGMCLEVEILVSGKVWGS